MDTIIKNIDVMSLFVRLERLEATVAKLEKENKALRKENAELKQENVELKKQLAKKDKRIARLEPTNNLAEQAIRVVVISLFYPVNGYKKSISSVSKSCFP